jgi:hypothetical protein
MLVQPFESQTEKDEDPYVLSIISIIMLMCTIAVPSKKLFRNECTMQYTGRDTGRERNEKHIVATF